MILDVTTLEVNAVTSAPLQSPYCGMNDGDGHPEFASDVIKKAENYIFNEHQLIRVDNQDTDEDTKHKDSNNEDTNYENTNYLAYILIFPQSMILFLTQNHYC